MSNESQRSGLSFVSKRGQVQSFARPAPYKQSLPHGSGSPPMPFAPPAVYRSRRTMTHARTSHMSRHASSNTLHEAVQSPVEVHDDYQLFPTHGFNQRGNGFDNSTHRVSSDQESSSVINMPHTSFQSRVKDPHPNNTSTWLPFPKTEKPPHIRVQTSLRPGTAKQEEEDMSSHTVYTPSPSAELENDNIPPMPTFVREARVTSEETTSSGLAQSREQSKRAHELMEEYASMETLVEDQRSQITQLREELDSNKRSLDSLRQSLAREQTSAVKAAQATRDKFNSYARLVHELKAEHEKSADDNAVQNLSSDFQTLRSSVSSLTHDFESILENGKVFLKRSDISSQIQEIREEYNNAQQVIDLLRERQQIAGAEHGLTIERLAQVESIVRQQREEARCLSDELIDSHCTIARQQIELETLGDHLRQQASNYGDQSKGRARLEADNQTLMAKLEGLSKELESSHQTLDHARGEIESEKATAVQMERDLRARMSEQNIEIASLSTSIQASKDLLAEREALVRSLETSLSDANSRAILANESLQTATDRIHELDSQISLKKAREEILTTTQDQLNAVTKENRAALSEARNVSSKWEARCNALDKQVAELLQQVDVANKKAAEFDDRTQCTQSEKEVLLERVLSLDADAKLARERHEDVLLKLQLANKSQADLQGQVRHWMAEVVGRSIIASKRELNQLFQNNLESSCRRLQSDLVVIQGREADLRAHINEATTARDSLENRLAKQDEEAQRVQRLFEHRFAQHDHEMHRMADSYENQLLQAHEGRKDADAALRARDKQLEAAAAAQAELRLLQQSQQDTSVDKAAAHAAEMETLKKQLDQRDETITHLNERAESISARHQANDLSTEERAFIHELMQKPQTIYERDMAASRNELRKRDAKIQELTSLVMSLKGLVAKENADAARVADTSVPATVANDSPILEQGDLSKEKVRVADTVTLLTAAGAPAPAVYVGPTTPSAEEHDGHVTSCRRPRTPNHAKKPGMSNFQYLSYNLSSPDDPTDTIDEFDNVPFPPPIRAPKRGHAQVANIEDIPTENKRPSRRLKEASGTEASAPSKNVKNTKITKIADGTTSSKPRARKARK